MNAVSRYVLKEERKKLPRRAQKSNLGISEYRRYSGIKFKSRLNEWILDISVIIITVTYSVYTLAKQSLSSFSNIQHAFPETPFSKPWNFHNEAKLSSLKAHQDTRS